MQHSQFFFLGDFPNSFVNLCCIKNISFLYEKCLALAMKELVVEVFVGLFAAHTIVELFYGIVWKRWVGKVCVRLAGIQVYIFCEPSPVSLCSFLCPMKYYMSQTALLHLNLVRIHMCHGEQLLRSTH